MQARSTAISRTNEGVCDRIRSRVRRIVPRTQRIYQDYFADFALEELDKFEYPVINYRRRSIDQILCAGFSADLVTRKAKRILYAAAGLNVPISLCEATDLMSESR
jgi:hypothetical protein